MSFFRKNKSLSLTSLVGFSITELMVVVGIIAILGVLGLGAYDSFRANARRAEVQSNLSFINKLQNTYQQRYDRYWNGRTEPGTAGASVMDTVATGYGYRGAGAHTCQQNELGFRLKNCDELRYRYWIAGADTGNYVAAAWAISDAQNWLFPRCTGAAIAGASQTLVTRDGAGAADAPATTHPVCNDVTATAQAGVSNVDLDTPVGTTPLIQGDMWCVGPQGTQVNLIDVVETCSQ